MSLKIASFLAFVFAVLGVVYLLEKNYILSKNPIAIGIQLCSIGFMIWARITFGIRSFHATANTTKGKLVTTGPYRWVRHPIYASVIYFTSASLISYQYIETFVAVFVIFIGLFVRMVLEEKFLMLEYEEYATYAKRTKRIIPFIV